jgi:cytoskeletal protein RodZ
MMMIENEPDPLRRIPIKPPAEIHAEVGAVLRAARLKRGQSLEAVAQQSRIPKRYLDALENDRFDEFPAFVYMRGFLKGYCEHLDVNFDEIWAKIEAPAPRADASTSAPAPGPAASAAPAPAPAAATPKPAPAPTPKPATPSHAPTPIPPPVKVHQQSAPASHSAPHESSSATGALLVAGAVFLGLGIWIFRDHRPAEAAKAAETTPRALMPLPRAVEPKVTLRAVDDAWVRATVDGAVVFEGRIPKGAAMEWKPAHGVVLRTTSPAALQLVVNGAPQALANPNADGDYRIDVP